MALLDHRSDAQNPRFKKAGSVGIVTDRKLDDIKGPMVRVLDPATGKTSAWLPVEQEGTYGKQHFFCPRKGERVRINRQANGAEVGTVGKSFYNNSVKAPKVANLDVDYVEYDDKSSFVYDPQAKEWNISLQGKANIVAVDDVNLKTQSKANVTANEVTVNASSIVLNSNSVTITGVLFVDYIKPYQQPLVLATPQVKNADGSGAGS